VDHRRRTSPSRRPAQVRNHSSSLEQLARDAKVLQIYTGTDEIQITDIAKDLLRR
jgi:alkylation response protein AidB-like acyl-CoA dehydrogenase